MDDKDKTEDNPVENPFDDLQAMASESELDPDEKNDEKEQVAAPEAVTPAAAPATTPPAVPAAASTPARDVDPEKAAATSASQAEPQPPTPHQGISRSTTFPSQLSRSTGRQDDDNTPSNTTPVPNVADTIARRRGATLSSARISIEPDRQIQENRQTAGRQLDGGASIHSNRSGGLRERSTSNVSKRRPRFTTLGRPPTILRRQSVRASGVSLPSDQGIPGEFSLAGPESAQAAQNQPYVDPLYAQLNPAYVQPTNTRPVWGLAKPLPRVLRPGMVPAPSEINPNNATAPDNASQTGSKADNQSQLDVDIELGQPSLRRAGIFSAAGNLRDSRESRLLKRQHTFATLTSEGRPSGDDHRSTVAQSTSEPFPNFPSHGAMPTPIMEEEHERDDFFGPLPHRFSYQPSALGQEHINSDTEIDEDNANDWPGLTPWDVKVGNPEDEIHNHHTHWSIIRTRYREPLAEFLATLVQLTIAYCATIAVTVSNNPNNFSATFAWGFASMAGIYIAGGISGAHLNPAISIMLYVYRGFPLRKVPSYIISQLLAAFVAGLVSYGLYRTAIIDFGAGKGLSDGGTAEAFITSRRHATVDPTTAFFNEFVATACLAVVVLALGDDSNAPPGAGMSALVLGLVITVLCMAFGYNTGAAMNPARDFGPRLALWSVGYGSAIMRDGYWVYGPWVATILGAIFGGGAYDIAIFVGGESPINYPRKRIWRAGHKFKKRMKMRIRRESIPDALR